MAKKKSSKKRTVKSKKTTSKNKSKKSTKKSVKKNNIKKTNNTSSKFKPDLSYIPLFAKKTGKPVEYVQKLAKEQVSKLKKLYPKWKPEKLYPKARLRVFGILKKEMSSNAIPFYVRKITSPPPFDFGNRRYQKHLALAKENPKWAKDNNFVKFEVNARGKKIPIPIDNEPKNKWKTNGEYGVNTNFRHPLPKHNWIQSMTFCGIPVEDYENENWDKLKGAILVNNKQFADPNNNESYLPDKFDNYGWYKCNFNIKIKKDEDGNEIEEPVWNLTPSVTSKPEYQPDIEDIDVETIFQCFEFMYVPLKELNEYHEAMVSDQHEAANKKGKELTKTSNGSNMIMTKGNVIDIQLSDGTNSHRIVIDTEDADFGDIDDDIIPQSTTIWADKSLKINFGKFSEILIFGSTSRTRKKDFLSNQFTEEWNQTSISAKGFCVIDLVQPEDNNNITEDDKDITLDLLNVTNADLDEEIESDETDEEEYESEDESDEEEYESDETDEKELEENNEDEDWSLD